MGTSSAAAVGTGIADPAVICLALCATARSERTGDCGEPWPTVYSIAWAEVEGGFTITNALTNAIETTLTIQTIRADGTVPYDGRIVVFRPPELFTLPVLPGGRVSVPPDECDGRPAFVFTNVPSEEWFALPLEGAVIRFEALNATRFTAITNFPAGGVLVEVAGGSYGPFSYGQHFSFAGFPGGGVTNFSVRPTVGVIPATVPFRLSFNNAMGAPLNTPGVIKCE